MYSSFFFFSSRRRHTRLQGDWSSDVCSSDLRQRKRCLRLACKDEPMAVLPDIEGLDSQAVAREEQALPRRVPQGEREHPVDALQPILAVLFVQMDQCLDRKSVV